MPRLVSATAAFLLFFCLGLVSGASADPAGDSRRPLRTGVLTPSVNGTQADTDFGRIAALGTSSILLILSWSDVVSPAAGGAADFHPRDPASAYYNWSLFDDQVVKAAAHGLDVIAMVMNAPAWALEAPRPGAPATLPSPAALGDFAAAGAARYSGSFGGLPAVRYWEAWNEPNISLFLAPQFVDGVPFSPDWYRRMTNEFYDAVKSVAPSDTVIAGGTAPFFDNTPEVTAIDPDWGPLSFMRHLLCLSETLEPTCSTPTKFDVWATHPYGEGGPTHRAALPNDVSVPDLPKMGAVLKAAQEAGHIVSSQPVELWATEFSWDSNRPDPGGVPEAVLMRWVPQALHSMWRSGVSHVSWLTLYDGPWVNLESGLSQRNGTLKRHARAFAFPLVGLSRRDQLEVWGRTPGGRSADVTIQHSTGGAWTTLGTLSSDADGIFQGHFEVAPSGAIRALAPSLGEQSADYPLGADPHVNEPYTAPGNTWLEPPPTWSRPTVPEPPSGGTSRRIEVEQRLRRGESP